MQTRKRAKSVSFGKKPKEKPEKEEAIKETAEEEVLTHAAKKVTEPESVKEEKKETPKSEEAPLSSELSTTLPKNEEEPAHEEHDEPSTATPANEFVSDSSLSASPAPVESEEESSPSTSEPEVEEKKSESPSSSTPLSTEPPQEEISVSQPVTTPEPQQGQEAQTPSAGNQSSTFSSNSSQSAFTLQSNEVQSMPGERKKRFGLYFFIIALVSFILGLGAIAAAGYFGLIKLSIPNIPMIAAKPTPTLIPTTMPTTAPTSSQVNLSAYTISVLNGSGITGKAGDVKTSLTTAGYKVTTTGNADNNNYTKTEVAAKTTVDKTYVSKLQADLGKSFTVDSTVNILPSSSPTDVTVTLGSQTAQ